MSSTDEQHWRFETSFATGSDLREPRFLSLGTRLFLYLSRLGSDPFAFEPQGFSVSELDGGRFGALGRSSGRGGVRWWCEHLFLR